MVLCPSTVIMAVMLFMVTLSLVAFIVYHFIYVSKAQTTCPILQEQKLL